MGRPGYARWFRSWRQRCRGGSVRMGDSRCRIGGSGIGEEPKTERRNAVTNASVVGQDMVRRVAVVSRKRTCRVAERAPGAPIPLGADGTSDDAKKITI